MLQPEALWSSGEPAAATGRDCSQLTALVTNDATHAHLPAAGRGAISPHRRPRSGTHPQGQHVHHAKGCRDCLPCAAATPAAVQQRSRWGWAGGCRRTRSRRRDAAATRWGGKTCVWPAPAAGWTHSPTPRVRPAAKHVCGDEWHAFGRSPARQAPAAGAGLPCSCSTRSTSSHLQCARVCAGMRVRAWQRHQQCRSCGALMAIAAPGSGRGNLAAGRCGGQNLSALSPYLPMQPTRACRPGCVAARPCDVNSASEPGRRWWKARPALMASGNSAGFWSLQLYQNSSASLFVTRAFGSRATPNITLREPPRKSLVNFRDTARGVYMRLPIGH